MEQILRTDNVTIGFREQKKDTGYIYGNINVSAGKSELVALFGPNGIGKSTLLRSLVKLLSPVSGDIFLFNKDIKTLSGNEMARKVGFVSTETIHVNNLKVYDLVSLGRYPYTNWMGRLRHHDKEKVEDAINMVGISALRNKYINQLSDGERQRAMIARTLAQDTGIIVLDEPTAFLDLPNKYEVVHLLHTLASGSNRTVVFSTHDLNIAIREADKIWLMLPEGLFQGSPEDLILNGSFGKMFEDTRLLFSTTKGDFRIKRKPSNTIGLEGPSMEYRWTRNALERIGYETVDTGEAGNMISIKTDDGKKIWEISGSSKTMRFGSIYDLCSFLTRLKDDG